MKNLLITFAKYIEGYKVLLTFNDGKTQIVNFEKLLKSERNPDYQKYLDIETFKTFKIDGGNIVWGENWDYIFPISQLYKGRIRI
jgi:hypothetical protein